MQTITLPDALHAAAEQQAAQVGFGTVDEYVADLIRREVQRHALSRPTLRGETVQESATVFANGNGAASRELPIADFMEPVEYAWTEAGFEARQALKRYTEETHADY